MELHTSHRVRAGTRLGSLMRIVRERAGDGEAQYAVGAQLWQRATQRKTALALSIGVRAKLPHLGPPARILPAASMLAQIDAQRNGDVVETTAWLRIYGSTRMSSGLDRADRFPERAKNSPDEALTRVRQARP